LPGKGPPKVAGMVRKNVADRVAPPAQVVVPAELAVG
jgi:hypothetical protein